MPYKYGMAILLVLTNLQELKLSPVPLESARGTIYGVSKYFCGATCLKKVMTLVVTQVTTEVCTHRAHHWALL